MATLINEPPAGAVAAPKTASDGKTPAAPPAYKPSAIEIKRIGKFIGSELAQREVAKEFTAKASEARRAARDARKTLLAWMKSGDLAVVKTPLQAPDGKPLYLRLKPTSHDSTISQSVLASALEAATAQETLAAKRSALDEARKAAAAESGTAKKARLSATKSALLAQSEQELQITAFVEALLDAVRGAIRKFGEGVVLEPTAGRGADPSSLHAIDELDSDAGACLRALVDAKARGAAISSARKEHADKLLQRAAAARAATMVVLERAAAAKAGLSAGLQDAPPDAQCATPLANATMQANYPINGVMRQVIIRNAVSIRNRSITLTALKACARAALQRLKNDEASQLVATAVANNKMRGKKNGKRSSADETDASITAGSATAVIDSLAQHREQLLAMILDELRAHPDQQPITTTKLCIRLVPLPRKPETAKGEPEDGRQTDATGNELERVQSQQSSNDAAVHAGAKTAPKAKKRGVESVPAVAADKDGIQHQQQQHVQQKPRLQLKKALVKQRGDDASTVLSSLAPSTVTTAASAATSTGTTSKRRRFIPPVEKVAAHAEMLQN